MALGHGHHSSNEKSLIPVICAVAILGYGFGFTLRANEPPAASLQRNAGPGYSEPLPDKGPPDAPVVLIAVADLRCVYCMKRNTLLKRLLTEHENDVRIVFKHFPFVSPEYSEKGALAAMAAQRQKRFWEYVDMLYEHRTDPWTEAELTAYAESLGLDAPKFLKDLNDPAIRDYVRYDRAAAEELNIRATPSLLVNGLVVPNWANAADVRKMIRASKREVIELVRSGQASDFVDARAMVAAKNHPAGEEFAKRYMYNDVSDLSESSTLN